MVISASQSSPQDPFSLVESCQKAIEWILRSYTTQGKPIPRCWIDVPYGEEEITLLEEEVLPVMAAILRRVEEIDQRLEADIAPAPEGHTPEEQGPKG